MTRTKGAKDKKPRGYSKGSPEERFWRNVVDLPNGCLQWTAGIDDNGYGEFNIAPNNVVYAHIFAWQLDHGAIPEGFELDHLCRNRSCVNVNHMEIVTHFENLRRGSHRGHPWEPPMLEVGR